MHYQEHMYINNKLNRLSGIIKREGNWGIILCTQGTYCATPRGNTLIGPIQIG